MALGLWLMEARRLGEPFRAMFLLALSTSYLMLFNPMNESNSYVILAPALGLWAVAAIPGVSNPQVRMADGFHQLIDGSSAQPAAPYFRQLLCAMLAPGDDNGFYHHAGLLAPASGQPVCRHSGSAVKASI